MGLRSLLRAPPLVGARSRPIGIAMRRAENRTDRARLAAVTAEPGAVALETLAATAC